ncbi:heme/hemin ABC transporter substrate-binding protein [Pseudovibrio exalbescens]|uniref:heme/hemin ABC transporter substrate-binding protein n=1 Tax=Pseudovibrio exalbescens TaxID=197461 RepID=UPI002364FE44|nr:ABC transporter substrate-binding protein [Pseudovibrio exalbescens]
MAILVLLALPQASFTANAQSESRVVAIGSSATEIVYALGEEDRLVAVDTTSSYPEAAAKLPNVGYIRALSAEGLLSVEPELVLMMEGAGPAATLDVLKASAVPLISIPEGFSKAAIIEKIRVIGEALEVEDKAQVLAAKVSADMDAAINDAAQSGAKPKVMFVLSIAGDRLTVAGTDTAAEAIIELAGGENAMTGFSGYKPVVTEALLSAKPDVVLMMDRHGGANMKEALNSFAALKQTPAGQNQAFIAMNGAYLLGFGPRTADAIRELSAQLKAFAPKG